MAVGNLYLLLWYDGLLLYDRDNDIYIQQMLENQHSVLPSLVLENNVPCGGQMKPFPEECSNNNFAQNLIRAQQYSGFYPKYSP